MDCIIRILIERLVVKGMEISAIPAFIRNLANKFAVNAYLSREELNRQLELTGWHDFDLDDRTLKLIMTVLVSDDSKNIELSGSLLDGSNFNHNDANSKPSSAEASYESEMLSPRHLRISRRNQMMPSLKPIQSLSRW